MTVQKEKSFGPEKFLINVEDYQRMGKVGIFHNKNKVELLDGIIYYKYADGKQYLISVEDYHLMDKAGIFNDKGRVELIDGQIYTISPITPDHNGHVNKVSRFFNKQLEDVIVQTQGSIRTGINSQPKPDIALLKFDKHFYSKKQATAADTLLIIEVAVYTIKNDRTTKKKKYAAAGIPEYWIVIPKKGIIEVYQQPVEGEYAKKTTYKKKSKWTIEPFSLEVKGSDFLID